MSRLWQAEVFSTLRIRQVEEVTSTSDLIADCFVKAQAGEGDAVLAACQTAGRGRNGKLWQSPKGNMYLSLVLEPSRPQQEWPGVALVSALALRDALAGWIAEPQLQLKWPNDVLLGNRKIAGLLLEARGTALVLGCGVNIVSAPPPDMTRWPATAMADHCRKPPQPIALAEAFGRRLASRYQRWTELGLEDQRLEWQDAASQIGQLLAVDCGPAGVKHGRFIGLEKDGAMRLSGNDETPVIIHAGEVLSARPVDAGG